MAVSEKKTTKKLVRSKKDRVIGGVAGGLAEYFEIDTVLIRAAFAALVLFNGLGLVSYLILWLLLPSSKKKASATEETMRENIEEMRSEAKKWVGELKKPSTVSEEETPSRRNWIGWAFIILGGFLLLKNFGIIDSVFWGPSILVALGLLLLLR